MRQKTNFTHSLSYCFLLALLVPKIALSLPNGKPFQELKDLIDSNSEEITVVRQNLNNLTYELEGLVQEVANTNKALNDLKDAVQSNTSDIEYAISLLTDVRNDISELSILTLANQEALNEFSTTINELEGAIDTQRYELLTLIDAQRIQLDIQIQELSDLRSEINIIAEGNITLAQLLAAQALTIADLAETQNSSFSSIQAEVDLLNTNLTLSNANYIYLTSAYDDLETQINELLAQIEVLEQAVAEIDTQTVDASGGNGSSGPVVLSFTDEYDTNDVQHVSLLRDFLASNNSVSRWVHVIFSTPALGRSTEICFLDQNDVFSQAQRIDSHQFIARENGPGSVRMNAGAWQDVSNIVVQTRQDAILNYVFVRAPEITNAVTSLIDLRTGSPLYDSYHQRRYLTAESQSPTTATYTIGDSRMAVCGY
jgi:peptidoglycan hydrolase CwlO-like protein